MLHHLDRPHREARFLSSSRGTKTSNCSVPGSSFKHRALCAISNGKYSSLRPGAISMVATIASFGISVFPLGKDDQHLFTGLSYLPSLPHASQSSHHPATAAATPSPHPICCTRPAATLQVVCSLLCPARVADLPKLHDRLNLFGALGRFRGTFYLPRNTAERRSTNDWMPSFMSSLLKTRSLILGM